MQILINPLAPYAVMALVLVLTIFLFLNLKYEHARTLKGLQTRYETLEAQCRSLEEGPHRKASADVRTIAPAKEPVTPRPEPEAESGSMNLTRRSQAIQLHRLGQSSEEISAVLQVPRNEVDLLLKVHQTVLTNQGLLRGLAALR